MKFTHTDDRRMLADTMARYLRERYSFTERKAAAGSPAGWSADHWSALAELGVLGALFGEADGGFGGMGFDLAAVFEPVGAALMVEPLLGVAVAGRALARAGGQDALIGAIIAGEVRVLPAWEEIDSHFDPERVATAAARDGDAWFLRGAKAVVAQAGAADQLLVTAGIAGQEGVALFLIDADAPGVTIRAYPLIDGGRGGDVLLDGARATLVSRRASPIVEEAIAAAIVALAWESIGIMDVLKDATLDYLRTRVQFGVPIGSFQALRHRMATVAVEIEQARSAAINAAAALDGDRLARERAVSAAKVTVDRVGTLVAEEAIQMHGGIGMTWELPVPHYAKRLLMIGHQLGDEDHHLQRYVALGRAA